MTLQDNLIPAKREDIEKYNKLTSFIDNKEYTKLSFSSNKNNSEGIWHVYLVYSTAVNEKLKEERLPLNQLTDIKELTILDLSANLEDEQ